jgi:predicted nucleic acid-binding Zn ribbon protein
MDRLIKTLPAILEAAVDSEEVAEAACIAAWKHAAGEPLSDHAAPIRLSEKKLMVVVADTLWQKQLQPMLGQVLFRLNSILGRPLVAYIELRVDPERLVRAHRPQEGRKRSIEQFSDRVPFELLSAAAAIQDAGLRRVFLGAALSCISRLEKSQI